MESLDITATKTNTTSSPLSFSPSSTSTPPPNQFSRISFSPSPLPLVVISPCAACKTLRRKCVEKCILAPYFPLTEPLKFKIAHKVFGANSIIKLLKELPESHRADAVSSMVYEANARVRDPVYGCVGLIWQLQEQLNELQEQLAKVQAEIVNMQFQQTNLIALNSMGMQQTCTNFMISSPPLSLDHNNVGSLHDSYWSTLRPL
ncbi:hypothetical protein HHK36_019436 [Tetracentron sinense]|uniref:LOB domain-containing protein n=1 Tax=Tetracentron sinense TaxID=13715 RepID=A0A834YXI5_TETSI|nr:hypothetical protein HHK36_019436 [Tetracentron sinense]